MFSEALFERLIFGGAYIQRSLPTEEKLRFKVYWASLIVGRKFTIFAFLFYGALYLERRFNGGFFAL